MIWKVCGMRDEGNIRQVAMLRPDMMGFIFYPGSPRYVGEDFPQASLSVLGDIPKVGVFVNQETKYILGKVKKYGLMYVQMHGDETPEQVKELSAEVQVIKAVPGNRLPSQPELTAYEPFITYWLMDTRTGSRYGGTGQTFDWSVIATLKLQRPVILSGGIDEAAVAGIRNLALAGVAGVDINSKAEDSPGIKNVEKLKSIYNELHG